MIVSAVVLSAVVSSCNGAQTQGKWEYKIVNLDDEHLYSKNIKKGETLINSLGSEGWEIVAVAGQGGSSQYDIISFI